MKNRKVYIEILNTRYEIIDTQNNITLADSFLLNKIGKGHGEAKLYIGNSSEELYEFWENFSNENIEYFILKNDCYSYLQKAENEYKNPSQNYINKENFSSIYSKNLEYLNKISDEKLTCEITLSEVKPPRIYLKSNAIFNIIRSIALPNFSYISVIKMKEVKTKKIHFYFKLFFADNSTELNNVYETTENLKNTNINININNNIRKGQAKYREKLLEDCSFCPITLVNDERILIASHIKPYAKSNEKEQFDVNNGFIFTPTYDRLFDKGFISFNDDKTMLVSVWLSPLNQKRLNIYNGKKIEKLPLNDERKKYLEYHRNNIFKK